jgi:membrane protease YdiL (CAAX protease family)
MFSSGKTLPKKLYLLGVLVIFAAVYSQYFIKLGQVTGYLVVYGIPVLVVSLMFGREMLQKANQNGGKALKLGLGLFGVLTAVGIFLSVVALLIINNFDPNAMELLSKPNPVLDVPPNVAWIMIAISLLVIGPVEEYLFRGFMYGGLLSMTKGKHWLPLAIVSSFLFASVHAYYAITYGVVSIIPFITIITFSIAMSITYYYSGGNILVPAVIHGVYDATGFLGVATTTDAGLAARGTLIFICVLIGFILAITYLIKKTRINPPSNIPPETKVQQNFPQA